MTRQIPKEEWKQFCDKLSRDRSDWLTEVRVLSSDTGAQILLDGLPFTGLAYEKSDDGETIVLNAGTGADSHISHVIESPTMIAINESDDNNRTTLDFEDASGTKTLVTFSRQVSESLVEEADDQQSMASR